MLTNAECRTRAQNRIKKVPSAGEPDKSKLLHLAQYWLVLADGGLPMPTAIAKLETERGPALRAVG